MIKMKKKKFVILIVSVVLATLMAAGGVFFLVAGMADLTLVSKTEYETAKEIGKKYEKLYQLQSMVKDKFLWDYDEEALMESIYKTAVEELEDKYSYYMTEEEYGKWYDTIQGTFTGIGVVFTQDDDGTYVVNRVIEGGPAALGGMKAGDILLKVDGKTYDDSTTMATAIRGDAGTSVEVTFERDGKEVTLKLVRAEVTELSVYSSVIEEGKDKFGYIQITSFEAETAKQFETELADLEGKGVDGLIIDLRNNPGGMVDQCVEIADQLLPECMITYTEDKNGEKETYNSDEHSTKLEYVLLINENSASASEIVAAAVKDNKGGALVGKKTFGKGIIQGTVGFDDGSAMSLTIMQYFSPNGNKIHKVGVKPDHKVNLPEDAKSDLQLEKALELLK